MPRFARYMSGNKGTEAPSNLLFFDTESHWDGKQKRHGTTTHTLKLWCAIALRLEKGKVTRLEKAHGYDEESFWEFHASRELTARPLWSFAHNLGFDLTLLQFWKHLESGRFNVGPIERPPNKKTGKPRRPWIGKLCLEGRPTFAVVRGQVNKCRFVDTSNYWPTRLASIGEKFGLKKLEINFATATDEELLTYCYRDAEICQLAVCDLINRWVAENSGVFQMTAASLALTNWRHICDVRTNDGEKLKLLIEPTHPAVPLERRGYYGGRVEPFYVGEVKGRVHALDVNSLYLGVMSSEQYPRKRLRRVDGCSPDSLFRWMHAYGAVADVYLETLHDTYPTRPYGVQLHARGKFHTTLCGPELFRALKAGHVKRVGECWLYVLAPLFRSWADYWYRRKLDAQTGKRSNEADAEFAKLVGNSLSGKFGQRGEYWKDTPEVPCINAWGVWSVGDHEAGTLQLYRGVAGKTQTRVTGDDPEHAFPLISAYITAHAREYMRSLFALCPDKSIYYSATDSIVCNEDAYQCLLAANKIHPTNIGELKVKGTYQRLLIHGCNHYELDDWVVCSGHVAKAKLGDDGKMVADIWQGLPSIIGSRPNGKVIVCHREVSHLQPTPKGIRHADGWVEPFRLSPDPDFTDHPSTKPHPRFRL